MEKLIILLPSILFLVRLIVINALLKSMNPFSLKDKVAPSFFETILKSEPKFNAIIEINNLLATKDLRSITGEEVEEITLKYKVNIKKTYREHFQNFYTLYLQHCFDDSKLTKVELEDLQHLKKILHLSDKETSEITSLISESVYAEETKKALTDGRLTDEEKRFLEDLKGNLSISEDTAQKIYSELAQDYFKNFFSEIVSDNRISLEEEKELREIAKSLGLEVNMDDQAKSTFDKMKLLWLIENNKIPEINANVPLLNAEICYFKTTCQWMEEAEAEGKSLVNRKAYDYRASGADNFSIKPEDDLSVVDKGQLYLTNKRLIFTGASGGKTIAINKISNVYPFINGVEIKKENEKVFLNFHDHVDVFVAILSRTVPV
ncbi:MAG TPA: hypothetical protein VD908_06160 [Cytophagales bacterium]|nr:hypothetical protein [Cytophagales bacterium]